MQYIFAGICFIGVVAGIIFLGSLNLGGVLNIAIITPLVVLAVYSLARIQPKETNPGKDTKN